MSSLTLTSQAFFNTWSSHSVLDRVIQNAVAGTYGFVPTMAYVDDDNRAKPLDKHLSRILQRVASGSIDELTLSAVDSEIPPLANLSWSRTPGVPCTFSIEKPCSPEWGAAQGVAELVRLAEQVIADSHAEYAYVHDKADWARLHHERRGHLLMIRSCARGPFWLTYYCAAYVERLGGAGLLLSAPAHVTRRLGDGGVLLLSHPDPLHMDQEPRRGELQRLHEYLQSLVPQDYRP